ncbi:MAG: hypothetical protein LBS74_10365 [Oscillospiraceae bacterium]|nr:hypothetical protein [Oscillospiraceae bacterium]
MTSREYVKKEIDLLPDSVIERIQEFISFQRYSMGIFENDTDYLNSIPKMAASINEGIETPLSDCVPLSEVWPDV